MRRVTMTDPVEPEAILRAEIEELVQNRAETLQEMEDLVQRQARLIRTVRMQTAQLERRLRSLDHRLRTERGDQSPAG
jgi:hypothetical protein